jgi:hypothetical protein
MTQQHEDGGEVTDQPGVHPTQFFAPQTGFYFGLIGIE